MTKITCTKLKQSAEIHLKENILDAFEKIQMLLPQGCRSGSCGVCVVEVIEGCEHLIPAGQIELNTLSRLYSEELSRGKKLRLACRSQINNEQTSKEIKIKSSIN